MKRLCCRYRYKTRKIIGIVLGIVGALIILKFIPIEILLFSIGVVLVVMGILILKTK